MYYKKIIRISFIIALFSAFISFLWLAFISLQGADFEVSVVKKGKLSCHNHISYNSKAKPINCEVSGVVYNNGVIYFATDWWKNNMPNFFSSRWNSDSNNIEVVNEIKQPTINDTKKIEELTLSQNGEYVLAMSSFGFGPLWDKVWKPMNRLLYWPSNKPHLAKVLDFEDTPNEELLRSKILDVVKARYPDTEFVKVEGLTVLPNNRLMMGIRERGVRFDQFEYQSILLSISYTVSENGDLHLTGDFEFISEIDFSHPKLQRVYSLSSLEYDFNNHVLYALATSEEGDIPNKFSTSLWRIYSNDNYVSEKGVRVEIAKDSTGSPLLLPHKLEGISKIKESTYIAVADDDKDVETSDGIRKPFEAFYYVFNFTSSSTVDSHRFVNAVFLNKVTPVMSKLPMFGMNFLIGEFRDFYERFLKNVI